MKKLSILIIGLLLVTGFAVAADFDGTVAISGSASVTFGVDLDNNYTGFFNDATSTASITLVAKQSVTTSGDDDLYGEITVADVQIKLADTDGTDTITIASGTVSAKIVVSPVEILIYAAPGMSWGSASSPDDGDGIAPALVAANVIGGITIVLPVDPATINVYFVSDGDWATAPNTANDYAVGADVEVVIDIITVDLGGYYGWFNASGTYGLTAAAAVALADVMGGVDVSVGFDLDATGWEVSFGTAVAVVTDADVTIDVGYSSAWDLDVELGFAEETAGGLVDALGASLTVQLFNLMSGAIVWNVDVTGEYDAGGLMPYFGFGMGSDNIIDVNVGVELDAAFTGIDNTTVTLDWATADINNFLGIITLMTEVSL